MSCRVLALAIGLAGARPVAAQLCLGRPAPDAAPAHVGVQYIAHPESQREAGVGLGYASMSGLFVSAGMAVAMPAIPEGNAVSTEIWLGGTISPSDSRIVFCPLSGLRYTSGPALTEVGGVQVTGSELAYSLGASIGAPLHAGSVLQIVPFAGVYYQRRQFSASDMVGSSADKFNNGLYEIGLAVVARRRWSIAPVMRSIFTFDRSDPPTYGVRMSYGFGK